MSYFLAVVWNLLLFVLYENVPDVFFEVEVFAKDESFVQVFFELRENRLGFVIFVNNESIEVEHGGNFGS